MLHYLSQQSVGSASFPATAFSA